MLGFPLQGTTIGTHYSEGHRVRLTVMIGKAPDPTEAQLVKVAEVRDILCMRVIYVGVVCVMRECARIKNIYIHTHTCIQHR